MRINLHRLEILLSITTMITILSCSNRNKLPDQVVNNVINAIADSLYFESIIDSNDSNSYTQSLSLWYYSDSSVMFRLRPDSINIRGDGIWWAEDVTPERGLSKIHYKGIEYDAIEYISYSKGVKLGLKMNISDTSMASVSVVSDTIPPIIPAKNIMTRK